MALRLPRLDVRSPWVARWSERASRAGAALAAIVLFPVAIHVLQAGASSVAAPLRAFLGPRSLASLLGLGWLVSAGALSGSPIAAAALSILDGGVLDERQCFALVVGTRFGAITVALALGAIYALRPGASRAGLEVAILSFVTTQVAGWLSLPLGLALLPLRLFDLTLPGSFERAFDRAAAPTLELAKSLLPGWSLFVVGLAGVLLAFKLIDLALPKGEPRRVGEARWWRENPLFPFALGILVTLVTPSVTISVGALVPLRAKGLVTSQRLVPYVLGANVAAFSDTLLAALLLGNPLAVNVVMTEIVSIALAALVLLAAHRAIEERLVRASERLARTPARAAAFFAVALAVPVALACVR